MKNEYQVSERNAIVEDHLWCIDSVIRQNYTLIKAARLDLDDVYQTLALRLIRAVAGYLCTQVLRHAHPSDSLAGFERITDGWCLTAHGVIQYEDGTIEWNYSSGGHWSHKINL